MALLTLVRHGQASFLAENYDQLSTLGERQAAMLGEYWAQARTKFGQVYFGPAERQVRTGAIAVEICRQAGLTIPDPIPLPEVDEYQGIQAMRTFLPGLMEQHEDIREMESAFRKAGDRSAAGRLYDRLFQRITRMWVAGELDSPDVEPWEDFCERVRAGIARVRESSDGAGNTVVFTSGGVIAATARIALGLSPEKTLELSWASRNASYAEFLFSGKRFSLSSFNNIPHLQGVGMVTHR